MDEKDRGEEGGIKVEDRRRFDSEGHAREGAEDRAPAAGAKDAAAGGARGGGEQPALNFSTFVLSLATSAQVHLGAVPNPMTGKAEPNLPFAKETIDLIGMLEEKTRGNLTEDERRLLEHVLYDLRMMYIELSQKKEG
jgi:hypothetical protein